MIKRLALALILLVAWPAAAQVKTVAVASLTQPSAKDTTLALTVSLYGYTKGGVPRALQTVTVAPVSLVQTEIRAEFPASNVEVWLTQLVAKATVNGSTYQTTAETVAPTQPMNHLVVPGNKVWAVYNSQQGQLKFYVGTPPPGSTTPPSTGGASPSGTRITQVGQSLTDSAGNKWSLGPPDPTRGTAPVILRNGTVMGVAFELVWQNTLIYARNGGGWWSIGPTQTAGWVRASAPA
jgi:hypothetical protein